MNIPVFLGCELCILLGFIMGWIMRGTKPRPIVNEYKCPYCDTIDNDYQAPCSQD